MSSVRDNTPAGASTIPLPPTGTDPSAAEGTAGAATQPMLTEAAADARHARAEEDFQKRQTAFQSDFAKKISDPPGFGDNETKFSKNLKQGIAASNLPVPTKQQVQITQANLGQTKEFKAAVDGVKSIMDNGGVVPPNVNMGQLFTQALGASPVLSKTNVSSASTKIGASSTGSDGANATADNSAANASTGTQGVSTTQTAVSEPASSTNTNVQGQATSSSSAPGTAQELSTGTSTSAGGTTGAPASDSAASTPMASSGSGLPVTTNTSALVFLVILQAQQETTKEKGDVLRKIQMYNGMLDAVNDYSNSKLIPAQKQIQSLENAGKNQKNFNASNVQVEVDGAFSSLDTTNCMQDADTGKVVLMGTQAGRQLVDSTSLGNLIQQADQWRTSIQNNQTQQSNRFQAKDNQMSSAWNILNAILKNTHDGVSSTVRNI